MTTEEIYTALMSAFQEKTGLSGDCSPELSVRFYAVAAQLQAIYAQGEWVRAQCFPQTATGDSLDSHAQLRGLTRKEAARAAGTLRFRVNTPLQVDLSIPAGTVCMTPGLVEFETCQEGTLAAGAQWVDVAAQAVEPGAAGNVRAAAIVSMATAPVGITACTNPEAFSGGADREEDEALRARVLATYARLSNGANAAYYEQEALNLEGVAAATVLGRNRGIGTVDIIIAGQSGLPSQELLDQVEEYFQQRREIAVDVAVLAPETQSVNVLVRVTPAPGADSAQVLERVRQAVTNFFDGSRLGKGVLRAELTALIFQLEGVANCTVVNPSGDVAGDAQTLPVLGTLTVTEVS